MRVFRQTLSLAENLGEADASDTFATSFFGRYLRFTPLLWMLGALIPYAAVMLIKLAIEKWPKGRLINLVVLSWLSIAIAQASCSILNGLILHNFGMGLRNAFSFTAIGWAFGALAIAVGNSWSLSNRRTAHYIANLGGYIILLSIIALAGALAGRTELRMLTPIGMLLPSGNATNFYASMTIFQSEDTLGESRIRLILFFPWATALGLGGLAIALISSEAEQGWRRVFGMTGGAIGVVFSWSRIAVAAMVLVAAILIFIKLPRYLQILGTVTVSVAIYGLSIVGLDPITLLTDMHDAADQARAGSSLARDLIYEKSWEGFLQSPIIGNGWIGESVHRTENLPIGSHSTVFGLFYTGGIITFACFAIAMLVTIFALLYAVYRWRNDKPRQQSAIIGCCLWLSLLLYCPYESLFSLTLPCLYLFTWIGGVIPGDPEEEAQAAAPRRGRAIFIRPDSPAGDGGAVGEPLRADGVNVAAGVKSSVFTVGQRRQGDRYDIADNGWSENGWHAGRAFRADP
ncbi:MAG TPA: O-antigen ligase family protein [Dongiaceae bacterium]|nr:O-antigen ligase family protein [Dongiaceae bacterium]